MVAAGLVGGEGTAHIVGGGGGGVAKEPFGNNEDYEVERKKEKARQRWKILCLVKTSDPKTDVAARQERITEKVDDWMRKMVMKMHITADNDDEDGSNKTSSREGTKDEISDLKNRTNNILNQSIQTSIQRKTPNHVVPKDEMQRLQKKEETKQLKEQRDRMKARENAEWERERQLILDGKMKLKKEHLQKLDPVLKLHHEKIRMKKKASKGSRSPKPSMTRKIGHTTSSGTTGPGSTTSSMSGSKSAIKLRWSSAMNRVSANALLEKKKKAAELEKLRQQQEELEEEKEKEKLLRVNRRKGGISGGPPHPLYHNLKANRLSTYYNAYDEVGTYLDAQNNEAHETMIDVEDATETVVAQLLYDEGKDELKSDFDELNEDSFYQKENEDKNDPDDSVNNKKESARMNPVYAALDDAKDVDDMFRIAEIWVNPSSYI